MTREDHYCCDKFKFALEYQQGIKRDWIGDQEYYFYDVVYNEPKYEVVDGELNLVKREYSTIKAILYHCNFCGGKLRND